MATHARGAEQPTGTSRTGYRADIDGLRAIAVAAVVLFHSELPGFSGGFAGVDIFFVISGFLIGGIVHREIGERRFSFGAFYVRRARRILPALITVSCATLILGMALLGPGELKQFALSAAAALGGLSNIWFLHASDYFAPDARLEPFLMTWSLGIEEQFYLLLPPLLLVLSRWRIRATLWITLAVSAASLLLAVIVTPRMPIEAFYLLPTRAWELGIGVALAMAHEAGLALPRRAQGGVAMVALAMIAAAIAFYDERAGFPGLAALLPTLGTLALIATPHSTINRRLLAAAPLPAIGRLSYSWYLWHWPLLALLRVSASGPVPMPLLAAVGLASIVPGYISWRWIEQPFRRAGVGRSNGATLARYGAALAGCLAVMLGVVAAGGLPARVGTDGARVEAMLEASRGNACLAPYGHRTPNLSPECVPTGGRPRIALLGDSHASALGDALRAQARAHGFDLVQMTAASCPPLLGATRRLPERPGASEACGAYNAAAIAHVARDPRVSLVVLTGFWGAPFSPHARETGEAYLDTDPRQQRRANADELRVALARTLAHLHAAGKRVLLLGDVPWIDFDPALHASSAFLPARAAIERRVTPGLDTRDGYVPRRFVQPFQDEGASIVAQAGPAAGVSTRSLRALLCDERRCRLSDGGMPFFVDQQHLSRAGADYVLARLAPELWTTTDR